MTVACILAVLVVIISSGRVGTIQAAPPVLSHNCTKMADGRLQCTVTEQPLAEAAADCRNLQTNMKNDAADHFYAGLFQQLDCSDTLARMP